MMHVTTECAPFSGRILAKATPRTLIFFCLNRPYRHVDGCDPCAQWVGLVLRLGIPHEPIRDEFPLKALVVRQRFHDVAPFSFFGTM
jgi:hypothetical protein